MAAVTAEAAEAAAALPVEAEVSSSVASAEAAAEAAIPDEEVAAVAVVEPASTGERDLSCHGRSATDVSGKVLA